ncbi:MAG: type I 3-dehydroquinate dehydratase [Rubrivivax sp.]|nr:type I 3-dehydroquinate dehydratase [Rubrivivax sp.]
MTPTRLIHLRGQPIAGGKLPLICTPLVGRTREEVLAEVAAVLPKAPDLLEWRVDFFAALGDAQAVIDTARAIRAACGDTPVLFTRRSTREGGQPITVTEANVVRVHEAVCDTRYVDMVDWEMSSDSAAFARIRSATQANGLPLVASYHNFQATPDAAWLAAKFAEAERLGAEVAKVAVMPQGPQDVLTLLAATHAASQTVAIPLISMSMGAYGSLSRMVGWAFGSTVTFAVGRGSSAPGQVPIEDLRAVLETTRKAVLGG